MTSAFPSRARLGRVVLSTADLNRALAFYQGVLGFDVQTRESGRAVLGLSAHALLELVERPGAQRDPQAAGLYHVAYLVPSRAALGRVLMRLGESGPALDGAADHAISEAVYLSDPDGHGIEIYSDREPAAWRDAEGRMPTVNGPLDLTGILAEARGEAAGLDPGTSIGHVHLESHDLAAARAFYEERLGLTLTADWAGRALFLAWGGYHHHLAVNRFHGRTKPQPRGRDVLGILSYESVLPDEASLAEIAARTGALRGEGGYLVEDPSAVPVRLTGAGVLSG